MRRKGCRNGPGTEGFHMRPHLLQLAWSCGITLVTTPKKHLKRKKFTHTQLWQLLSYFPLKLLSAQDVNF